MVSNALRSLKRRVSRFLGVEMLADHIRALTETIERSNEQLHLLRDQVGALRDDVSKLSAAINNVGSNVSLVYDCLIEFDREKRSKGD